MNTEYCSDEVLGFGIGLVLVVLMTFLVIYLLFFREPENLTQPVGMSQMLFGVLPRPTPLNGSTRRTY